MPLLRGLADTSARTELVAESRGSHDRLAVSADSGRHMRVFSGGRAVIDLLAGRRTPDWNGVYVRESSADAVHALHGSLVEPLTRERDDWRDKRIAAIAPESVTAVSVRRGGRGYDLVRDVKTGWQFRGGGRADSAAVASLLSAFHDLRASGFATAAQLDSIDMRRARVRLSVDARGSAPVRLSIDSTASAIWARADGDGGGVVYRIDSWLLNRIAPAESTLKARR